MTTAHAQFRYRASPDQTAAKPVRHPVVIVGAGPVGLSLALDLAERGVRPVLIDDNDRIGGGSRAICFAKRTLEIFDRLGVGESCLSKGVEWQKGRIFHRERELYGFDLLPEPGHRMPAFVNLQQYYVEGFLVDQALAHGGVDLRWKNRLASLEQRHTGVLLGIETPDGTYQIEADWVIACDGARSPTRDLLGLEFKGEVFEDQFLIADVKMTAAFPTERWFWFEPPFHGGQSALLHRQPDDVWRIDLQLSPTADARHEQKPEVVVPRIQRMLGHADFELEWVSVYRFQCRRIDRFVHGRVLLAGDAAHQVSPFGARGANSGVQDADNLGWKLARVVAGSSPPSLLESYHVERSAAADENILHSTRSTDFIAPHTPAERVLRDAALALAPKADFAKRMVNSGRLSTATAYAQSPLSTEDADVWPAGPRPGQVFADAPLVDAAGKSCFLSQLLPRGFGMLRWRGAEICLDDFDARTTRAFTDPEGLCTARYGATSGSTYLIRPDGHVAARWRALGQRGADAALRRAQGLL